MARDSFAASATSGPRHGEALANADGLVASFLGQPLRDGDDAVVVAFVVLDSQPRTWTLAEQGTVRKIAFCVQHELQQHAALATARHGTQPR